MSAVSRVLVRSRTRLAVPALRRVAPSPVRSLSSVSIARPAVASIGRRFHLGQLGQAKRYASTAEALAEEEEAAPSWPVREAPPLSEKDMKRITRQRNVGM